MAKFAGYGFNKSHAAAYALVSLPDRLAEGEPPGRVLRRLHGPRRSPTPTSSPPSARTPSAWALPVLPPDINRSERPLPGRGGGRRAVHPLRAGGREKGRAGGDGAPSLRLAATRRSPTSPTSPRGSTRGRSTRCSSRTWPAPAPSTRCTPNRQSVFAGAETDPAPRPGGRRGGADRPDRLVRRRRRARRVAPAAGPRLARHGAARLRGRGHRLPPHRPPARQLRAVARSASAWSPRRTWTPAPPPAPRGSRSPAAWSRRRSAPPGPAAAWPGSASPTAAAASR